MLELRETDACRLLLRETAALQSLRQQHPEKFKRLEHLLSRSSFDAKEVYQGTPKEKRRAAIAQGNYWRLKAVSSVTSFLRCLTFYEGLRYDHTNHYEHVPAVFTRLYFRRHWKTILTFSFPFVLSSTPHPGADGYVILWF